MSNDVLITPASRKIEFKDSSANVDAKIETDASGNLLITNTGGDISIGDTTSDIFVGDGTNNIDIVFEQDGEIRGTSGVTITLGQSDSNIRMATDLNLNSNDITNVGDLTVTGNLTITGDINSYNVTDLDVTDKTITLGVGQTEANSGSSGIIIDGSAASMLWDEGDNRWEFNKNIYAPVLYGSGAGITSLNASNISSGTLASARLPDLAVSDFAGSAIQTGSESFSDSDTILMTAAAVQDKILSYGYTTNTGTVSSLSDLSITSTAAELNKLDGYTGSVTELNYLDTLHATGVTSTEFDYLDGVTSNIQTQLDGKQASGSYLTGNQTITLSGDVSGSGTTSISVTIADDSHNHVISNVDGLQTALDAKLASSSYTASDVLTKIKTVDGAGSGLDADLLDGISSASFWRSDTSNDGAIRFNTTEYDFTSSYNPSEQGVPNSIRLWDHYTQTNAPATYGQLLDLYGRSGHWRHQFHMFGTDLRFRYGTYPLATAGWSSWYTQWHSGNDGSGSGLDADLLDGQHASAFLTGNQTITLSGDVSGSGTTSISVTIADDSHNHVISNVDGLQTALDAKLASSSYTASDVLTKIKTVDGSGSGLDADLLDGQHASAFLTGNQTITLSGDVSGSGTTSIAVTIADDSHNHVISNVDGLQTALDAKASLSGATFTGAITATTVNTGQGATEVHLMNQNVRTTDSPTFANLNLGADDTTPQISMLFDDHATGAGWDTRIEIGKSDDLTVGTGTFPTYVPSGAYGTHIQANSDGVFFGMEEYTTGNFRPIIQWGDDDTDTPFRIKHETGDEFTVSYNGIATATTRLSAPQVYATVASGTAPLVVTSTTLVSNLNADLLDGQQGSYYLDYNNFTNTPTIPSLSGYATESYVGTQISNLVDSAPGTLDTLNELAAALGDDANFSTTVTNSIATKMPLAGGTFTGGTTYNVAGNAITISSESPQMRFNDTTSGADDFWIHINSNRFYILADRGDDGSWETPYPLELNAGTNIGYIFGERAFTDAYHPNADAWTTSRTITLAGDLTGNVSISGSANVTLTATVVDDSHNHVISNVDGLQTALDGKLSTSGTAANSQLLDSIDSTGFLRSNANDTLSSTLKVTGSIIHEFNTAGGYIARPKGAQYVTSTNVHTGAIKIKLPTHGTDDMMSFWVDIYDYSTGESVTLWIGGYLYQTTGNNEWVNTTALIFTEQTGKAPENVRFGADGSNNCIWIGETTDTWSYPQIIVRDFQCGYSADIDAYDDNWAITFVTSFDTVDETHVAKGPVTEWDRVEGKPTIPTNNNQLTNGAGYITGNQTITLSGDASGSGTTSINVTVADDSHNHVISNIDGLQTALDAKLASSSYTASDVLTKIKTVDGSGSGLDADLLDGQGGTYYNQSAYTSTGNAAGSYLGGHYSSGGTEKPNSSTFGSGKFKIAMLSSSNLGFGGSWNDVFWNSSYNGSDVKKSTALVSSKYDNTSLWIVKQNYDSTSWGTGYLFWNAGNDGSGSGLDADLLDGQHASAFLTGNQTITLSGDVSGSGTTSIAVTIADDSHNHIISNVDGLQTALDGKLSTSGTAANSQLLDSLDSTAFLRSNADDTMSEKLTFSQFGSGAYMQNPGGVTFSSVTTGDGAVVLRNLTQGIRFDDENNWDYNKWAGIKYDSSATIMYIGGPAASQFTSNTSPPSIDINFVGLNSSGLKKDGNVVWHAGNDGSGSGLDADLLDGLQLHTGTNNVANRVVRTDGNGYIQAGWINTTSGATSSTLTRIYCSQDGYIRYQTPANFGVSISPHINYNTIANTPTIPTYSAGNGISLSGTTFSVSAGPGLVQLTDGLQVDSDQRGTIQSIGYNSSNTIHTDNGYISFRTNAGDRFKMESDGDFHATGDIVAYSTTPSDERLKENIQVVNGALEKVSQLKGVTFNWKKDGTHSAGLIAQDVEKVLPSAVKEKELSLTHNDGKKYKVIENSQITSLLVEAIKEQQKTIEKLTSRINDLEKGE